MASQLSGLVRRLFAGKAGGADESEESADFNGFTITPIYRRQGRQWLTAGIISKPHGAGIREHHYIRAETHADKEQAAAFAIAKAKQIIDERGDKLFDEAG